jgi:cobalt/nickel transport system ATP-binding protein
LGGVAVRGVRTVFDSGVQAMTHAVFELQALSYHYGENPVIRGVTVNIPRGARVALLGANGSGKSTLLKLLDALYFANHGEFRAFGDVVSESSFVDEDVNYAFRRRVGLVFQNPDVQLFNPTVFDELAFGPLQLGWPRERVLGAIEQSLARFALTHLRDRAPHRLSGGEKKRVALASVLIVEPEVLLLDEPTAALDPESQGEVIRFLMASRNTGQTVITATHDLEIVPEIADHVLIMSEGCLIASGPVDTVLADQDVLRRARLIHAHWHQHDDGALHVHEHTHRHEHSHRHDLPDMLGRYRPVRSGKS